MVPCDVLVNHPGSILASCPVFLGWALNPLWPWPGKSDYWKWVKASYLRCYFQFIIQCTVFPYCMYVMYFLFSLWNILDSLNKTVLADSWISCSRYEICIPEIPKGIIYTSYIFNTFISISKEVWSVRVLYPIMKVCSFHPQPYSSSFDPVIEQLCLLVTVQSWQLKLYSMRFMKHVPNNCHLTSGCRLHVCLLYL